MIRSTLEQARWLERARLNATSTGATMVGRANDKEK
jgi:hypothetical protein